MATKRKPSFNPSSYLSSKRSRPTPPLYESKPDNDSFGHSTYSRIDPTYGQRGAFPGLDDCQHGNDDALFYGPAGDGLEYLRMVR